MKQSTRKRMKKLTEIELFILVLSVLLLAIIYSQSSLEITGFSVLSEDIIFTDEVSINTSQTTTKIWTPEISGLLRKVAISGSLEGTGTAVVSLIHLDEKYVIYNTSVKTDVDNLLTGFVVLDDNLSNNTDENSTDTVTDNTTNDTTTVSLNNNSVIANDTNESSRAEQENSSNEAIDIDKSINAKLSFVTGSIYDENDDGIVIQNGVVDLAVNESEFSWDADESNVCSRYKIESLDDRTQTEVCYGPENCCSFAEIESSRPFWNDVYYSTYGTDGATENNKISAQIMHIDYNLSLANPYSNVVISDWSSQNISFKESILQFTEACEDTCYLPSLEPERYALLIETDNVTVRIDAIHYTVHIEEVSRFSFDKEFDNVSMMKNTVHKINLSNHFNDSEPIEFGSYDGLQHITVDINDNIATLRPDLNYTGTQFMYFTAKKDSESANSNIFRIDVTEKAIKETIEIGRPVVHVETVTINKSSEAIHIDLPKTATNISVTAVVNETIKEVEADELIVQVGRENKTIVEFEAEQEIEKKERELTILKEASEKNADVLIENEEVNKTDVSKKIKSLSEEIENKAQELKEERKLEKASVFSSITGAVVLEEDELYRSSSDNVSGNVTRLIIEQTVSEIVVEYVTEAPSVIETDTPKGKEVKIVSEEHYVNVSAYTDIVETEADLVRLYWVKNGSREVFNDVLRLDTNLNGLIDRVEWVVPHLSNQTFEVILVIDAEHLDSNRSLISDIYDSVKELDGNWSEVIPATHFVRVQFETELDSSRDISIYPVVVNGSPRIDVYEINSDFIVASFETVESNTYNKIYLTGLNETQDTFDLQILDGAISFDHIIDPTVCSVASNEFIDCSDLNWTAGNLSNHTVLGNGAGSNLTLWENVSKQYPNQSSTFYSQVFDAGSLVTWDSIHWDTKDAHQTEIGRAEGDSNFVADEDEFAINTSGLVLLMHFNNESTFEEATKEAGLNNKTVDYSVYVNAERAGSNQTNGSIYGADFDSSGVFGGQFDFERSDGDNYIEILNTPSFDLSNGDQVAICTWVTPESAAGLSKIVSLGDLTYALGASAGSFDWIIYDTTWRVIYSDSIFVIGRLYHVCGTFDGSTVRLYVDGEQQSTTISATFIRQDLTHNLRIGGNHEVDGQDFDGSIDEVSIWNRSLSSQEVLKLYKRGALRLNVSTRTSDDNDTWTAWSEGMNQSNSSIGVNSRYVQYKAEFNTTDANYTPVLNNVTLSYSAIAGDPLPELNISILINVTETTATEHIAASGHMNFTNNTNASSIGISAWINDSIATVVDYGTIFSVDIFENGTNFTSGTLENVSVNSSLTLGKNGSDQYPNSTGIFYSPIYDTQTNVNVTNISWEVGHAYQTEIGRAVGDIIDATGFYVNTSGLVLLMHFNNESDQYENSSYFKDYSVDVNSGREAENNGTVVGDVSVNVSYKKLGSGSIQSHGLSDGNYVQVPDHKSLSLDSWTISFWTYIHQFDGSGQVDIIAKFDAAPNRHFLLGYETNGDYYFSIRAADCNNARYAGNFPNTAPSLNTWVHTTWVHDADNNILSVYENGVRKANGSYTGTTCVDSSADLTIFNRMSNDEAFDGKIDELAIWNRTLNEDEIENLYMRGGAALNISVRVCDDSACSGESFSSILDNFSLDSVSSESQGQYFQYKTALFSESENLTPILYNISYSYNTIGTDSYGLYNFSYQVGTTGNYSLKVNSTVDSIYGEHTIAYGLLSSDSCSCPGTGDWEILNGDVCTLSSLCDVTPNSFRVLNGEMRVVSGGTIRAATCYVHDGEILYIDDDGALFCED